MDISVVKKWYKSIYLNPDLLLQSILNCASLHVVWFFQPFFSYRRSFLELVFPHWLHSFLVKWGWLLYTFGFSAPFSFPKAFWVAEYSKHYLSPLCFLSCIRSLLTHIVSKAGNCILCIINWLQTFIKARHLTICHLRGSSPNQTLFTVETLFSFLFFLPFSILSLAHNENYSIRKCI